jgi:hypothetical protein
MNMKKKEIRTREGSAEACCKISSTSGFLSILGGWQICHNICLGLLAILSSIGIVLSGMPLLFLNQYAVYIWSFALAMFLVSIAFYAKFRMPEKHLLAFNLAMLTAGVPFGEVQDSIQLFWAIGIAILLYAVFLYRTKKR